MFGVKELRGDVALLESKMIALETYTKTLRADRDRLMSDLALLLAHLKLEINTLPATPEKRVVEKAGTQAKRPKPPTTHPPDDYYARLQQAMGQQGQIFCTRETRGPFGRLFG